MSIKKIVFIIFLFTAVSLQAAFISAGSEWRYNDRGEINNNSWRDATFDDSSWMKGKAPFGGREQDSTILKDGPVSYFRKDFNVKDLTNVHGLYFNILLNGGAVIYLNGKEALRINLPQGDIQYNTPPLPPAAGVRISRYLDYLIDKNYTLKKGRNVLSVELHRDTSALQKSFFDLRLSPLILKPEAAGVKKLDSLAAFSFSIMSDNKGAGLENIHMYKCDRWIHEAGDRFILGLGDHVKDNRPNHFLTLLKNDTLWHKHFYPNVADGENEYWGKSQGDWGAGAPIFDYVDLAQRKNVIIRPDKCEYYALEEHKGIKVHIIQLHYSDTPKDAAIAFNESTRRYLMNTLDKINKTDKDIIVVLAHTGAWVNRLSAERRKKLLDKADLILGATTHHYQRYIFKDAGADSGAIAFNTGAVGNSAVNGFLQVHVMKNPTRFVIQYQITDKSSRKLQKEAFLKIINGRISPVNWTTFFKSEK